MPEDFDWRSGEETDDWDVSYPGKSKTGRGSFWSSRPLLLTILLLGISGLIIFQFINRRTKAATEMAKANVLTTHQLIRQADQQDDLELFLFSLSGRNPSWVKVQEQLLAPGSLWDRPTFDLKAVSDRPDLGDQGSKIVSVELSPDLTSAEVQFDQAYLIEDGRQAGTTVTLRQIAVYNRGDRWLFSSPTKDFWGDQESLTGDFVTASFPDRDREVIERLVPALDQLIRVACDELVDLTCATTLHVQLHFEDRLDSLLEAGEVGEVLRQDLDLHLPAPSLIGIPLDEEGYQLLQRGYSQILLPALISEQVGYQCCHQGPFHQAMLDYQLSELGLSAWPLTSSPDGQSNQGTGSNLFSLHDIGLFWFSNHINSPIEEIWPVYILVEFLGDEMGLSMTNLQQQLAQNSDLAYQNWLKEVATDLKLSEQELERAWLSYSLDQYPASPKILLEYPQQDLQLVCRPNQAVDASLYRYDFEKDTLTLERQLDKEEAFLLSLPDDEGVIVAEQRPADIISKARVFLWQDHTETSLVESENNLVPVSFSSFNRLTDEVLIVHSRRQRHYGLLALQECLSGGKCKPSYLNGHPLWSPDRSSLLTIVPSGSFGYEHRFERPLFLGGITGEIIGVGKEPYWLNNVEVAFISEQGKKLSVVDTQNQVRRTLLTAAQVAGALPSSHAEDKTHLTLEFASIDPNDPRSLIIVAQGLHRAYFFTVDRQAMAIELEHTTADIIAPRFLTDLRFSPDGRWLVISTNDLSYHISTVTFYDTILKMTMSYRFHSRHQLPMHWQMDWSADGRWLSIIDNGYIRLIAPEFDHQRLSVLDNVFCTSAAWVN